MDAARKSFYSFFSDVGFLHTVEVNIPSLSLFNKEDSKLQFLDCLLKRESDGMFTFTVYRKHTHRDLHFHHPNHVKRGIVRCLKQAFNISTYRKF